MARTAGASVQVAPRTHELREFPLREFPLPEIGPDDGLLRVEACGICGSDVEQFEDHEGRRPRDVIPAIASGDPDYARVNTARPEPEVGTWWE